MVRGQTIDQLYTRRMKEENQTGRIAKMEQILTTADQSQSQHRQSEGDQKQNSCTHGRLVSNNQQIVHDPKFPRQKPPAAAQHPGNMAGTGQPSQALIQSTFSNFCKNQSARFKRIGRKNAINSYQITVGEQKSPGGMEKYSAGVFGSGACIQQMGSQAFIKQKIQCSQILNSSTPGQEQKPMTCRSDEPESQSKSETLLETDSQVLVQKVQSQEQIEAQSEVESLLNSEEASESKAGDQILQEDPLDEVPVFQSKQQKIVGSLPSNVLIESNVYFEKPAEEEGKPNEPTRLLKNENFQTLLGQSGLLNKRNAYTRSQQQMLLKQATKLSSVYTPAVKKQALAHNKQHRRISSTNLPTLVPLSPATKKLTDPGKDAASPAGKVSSFQPASHRRKPKNLQLSRYILEAKALLKQP